MASGPYHWLKLHETHMQSQVFNIKGIAPNGQEFTQNIHGALEPIQLYRYVFPKAALPLVLKTFETDTKVPPNGLNMQAWALRKMLNLKEIPKDPLPGVKMSVTTNFLQLVPIGIKEDEDRLILKTGVFQEAL